MSSEEAPIPALNPVIHPVPRLRICALLAPVKEEEFSVLRDLLGVSDSALSKQLSALAEAGYLEQSRTKREGKSRVILRLTQQGLRAYQDHVQALRAMTASLE